MPKKHAPIRIISARIKKMFPGKFHSRYNPETVVILRSDVVDGYAVSKIIIRGLYEQRSYCSNAMVRVNSENEVYGLEFVSSKPPRITTYPRLIRIVSADFFYQEKELKIVEVIYKGGWSRGSSTEGAMTEFVVRLENGRIFALYVRGLYHASIYTIHNVHLDEKGDPTDVNIETRDSKKRIAIDRFERVS